MLAGGKQQFYAVISGNDKKKFSALLETEEEEQEANRRRADRSRGEVVDDHKKADIAFCGTSLQEAVAAHFRSAWEGGRSKESMDNGQ